MTIARVHGKTVLALIVAVLVAACSHGAGKQGIDASRPATSQAEIDAILLLLNNGEQGNAQKRISTALKSDALNPSLLVLRDSIEHKPEELLGPKSFPYVTQPGDTMSNLAEKFLGNRLKAYQLARYNGIEKPALLEAGRTLRIPRQAAQPAATTPRPQTKAAAPRPQIAAPPRPAAAPQAAAPKAAAPKAAAANPVAARQARTAGLAALNQGKPARAVSLLSRAAALDPDNPSIARDLARATRIAATVRAQD
jgi:LysM repeat protein